MALDPCGTVGWEKRRLRRRSDTLFKPRGSLRMWGGGRERLRPESPGFKIACGLVPCK